jgi:hypothetical protein
MIAHLATLKVEKQFTFKSDIDYADFRSRSCANLDVKESEAELGYRVSGHERGRTLPKPLNSANEFASAMSRIRGMIQRARTKEYGIEVVNMVSLSM